MKTQFITHGETGVRKKYSDIFCIEKKKRRGINVAPCVLEE